MNNGQRMITSLLAVFASGVTLGAAGAYAQCEVDQLNNPTDSANAFGCAVSVWNGRAVVGDPRLTPGLGAAYVFKQDGFSWILEAKLQPPVFLAPNGDNSDGFGQAVAISGNVVVVGASTAGFGKIHSGAAYVFRYDVEADAWRFEQRLLASDGDFGDIFGWSVSLDGDLLIVGARDDENDGVPQSGSAYIFRFDSAAGEWVEETKIVDPNGAARDLFGGSVSIRNNSALIGASGKNHACNLSGSAFVFRFNGSAWILEAELTAFEPSACGVFGFSAAHSVHVAVIGAFRSDDNGTDSGAAYVFRYNGARWIEEAKLLPSDGSSGAWFGHEVSVDPAGETIVVGAIRDDELGFESGSAYVFAYENNAWIERAKLTASDGSAMDCFGAAISTGQGFTIVSAPRPSESPGSVYAFAGLSGIDCNENGESDACDLFAEASEDLNGDGIPDECECPWDLDGDGSTQQFDLGTLLAAWGTNQSGPPDFDGDKVVAVPDLLALLAHWGSCQ